MINPVNQIKNGFLFSLWVIAEYYADTGITELQLSAYIKNPKKVIAFLRKESLILLKTTKPKVQPTYLITKKGLSLATQYEKQCEKVVYGIQSKNLNK